MYHIQPVLRAIESILSHYSVCGIWSRFWFKLFSWRENIAWTSEHVGKYMRHIILELHFEYWSSLEGPETNPWKYCTTLMNMTAWNQGAFAGIYVACNLRTCAVCRLHGAKYAVCRLHGTQSADCMVTVQTKDSSKTCDSFSKFQRNLRFSARINFLTKLPT